MQNNISGLLMEVGVNYSKKRLHGRRYFRELLELSRSSYEMFLSFQKRLVLTLRTESLIVDRAERLMTITGVGELTALIWVLEIGTGQRLALQEGLLLIC